MTFFAFFFIVCERVKKKVVELKTEVKSVQSNGMCIKWCGRPGKIIVGSSILTVFVKYLNINGVMTLEYGNNLAMIFCFKTIDGFAIIAILSSRHNFVIRVR